MGSFIEINDTLRISKAQGFPEELIIENHVKSAFELKDFEDRVFSFVNKPKIRVYKLPPIRNFLVEDLNGKWLYWGLCRIMSIQHDYVAQTTSGTYKIIKLNNPAEMKMAFDLIHNTNNGDNYFLN